MIQAEDLLQAWTILNAQSDKLDLKQRCLFIDVYWACCILLAFPLRTRKFNHHDLNCLNWDSAPATCTWAYSIPSIDGRLFVDICWPQSCTLALCDCNFYNACVICAKISHGWIWLHACDLGCTAITGRSEPCAIIQHVSVDVPFRGHCCSSCLTDVEGSQGSQ